MDYDNHVFIPHVVQTHDNLLLVRIYRQQQQQQQNEKSSSASTTSSSVVVENNGAQVPTQHTPGLTGEEENDSNNNNHNECEIDLSVSSSEVSSWIQNAARLLQQQWPTTTTTNDGTSYYEPLMVHHTPSACSNYPLACSYLLIRQKEAPSRHSVLGHGRLTECFESAGGNAAAATYILIDKEYRGYGYGQRLMELLEKESNKLGYHYVYLWTKTAVSFYKDRLGYQECHRVSLKRPCLKKLSTTSVQSLEATLSKRLQVHTQKNGITTKENVSNKNKRLETITLLPESATTGTDQQDDDDVWLKKRLVEHVGSTLVPIDERLQEIKQSFFGMQSATGSTCYYRWNPRIAWQPQIGPSCGLVAIRMIRDYYYDLVYNDNNNNSMEHQAVFPSLLSQAQQSGYTQDGEIFNAEHLAELLYRQIGDYGKETATTKSKSLFEIQTREIRSISRKEIDETIRQGGVWIIPYDSNPRTKLPTKLRGNHAHWGIVVGICYHQDNDEVGTGTTTAAADTWMELDNNSTVPIHLVHDSSSKCHLFIQHSLSRHWSIAPFDDWIESNQQLTSVDEHKFQLLDGPSQLNLQNKIIQVITCCILPK
jgi:N-acetylglutamate synthase-like GNAT family acetyltransferase